MKVKRFVCVLLVLLMVATLFCGTTMAATGINGRKAFSSAGTETNRYTVMRAAGYVINNGAGSTAIELRGSSYNISDRVFASTGVTSANVGKNTSYVTNTPYSTTFYTKVISTDTTGYIAVYVSQE